MATITSNGIVVFDAAAPDSTSPDSTAPDSGIPGACARDVFARDSLPPRDLWPDLVWDHPDLRYPERLNAAAELLDATVARGHGGRCCLIAPSGTWTYAQLQETVNRIGHVLADDLGLVPGNRVLLRAPNTPMLVACWLAVIKAGGIAIATMPLLRARELAYIIGTARVSLALCDHRLVADLTAAGERTPTLRRVVTFNGGGAMGLEALMAGKPVDFRAVDTAADDVCLIAFTSGTTGRAKAAMHFHRDVLAVADLSPRSILGSRPDDVFCGSPPMAFAFGLGALLAFPLRVGAASVLLERSTPELLLQAIEEYRATLCFTAPTAYRAMTGLVGFHDLSSLRACVSAGEALPLATFEGWRRATGLKIIDSIGSTEMLNCFIASPAAEIRAGATGRVVPGYEAMVVDADFRPLPPGQPGRLAVRGPTGCRYLDDPRQSEYVRHGWNVSGDSFIMDADGYFWFQGRTDDMIVSAGYNISGLEVEEVLLDHEAVLECAVVASPDPERGSVPKAFIVLNPGFRATDAMAQALQSFVKEQIAAFKYPRAVEFLDALPRTETGKVQRFKLRELELERARERCDQGGD